MGTLIDCDNFFCSCERIFRPDLNGKSVVVLSNNDGGMVTRLCETKMIGIKIETSYYRMREKFSEEPVAFSSNYLLNHERYQARVEIARLLHHN